MKTTVFLAAATLTLSACGGGSSEESTTEAEIAPAETAGAEAEVVAMQPDEGKMRAHSQDHIEYPADRAQILAACAETDEFSDGEKLWVEQNLPEGTYESAEQLMSALGYAAAE